MLHALLSPCASVKTAPTAEGQEKQKKSKRQITESKIGATLK
jgi:hypothetical protein